MGEKKREKEELDEMLQTIPQVSAVFAWHLAILSHSVLEATAGVGIAQANPADRTHQSLQIHRAAEFGNKGRCGEGEERGRLHRIYAARGFRERNGGLGALHPVL